MRNGSADRMVRTGALKMPAGLGLRIRKVVMPGVTQKKRWKSNSIATAQGWLAKLLTETVRRNDGQTFAQNFADMFQRGG
eukprot:COSAG02_NODE_23705_length_710_cov_1.458265_1_plen_80_part_00